MPYRLGVDLGTTFTAAAVSDGSEPTVIGLGNRALQIPSVLFLKPDGEFLVGEAAERRGLTEPDRLAREFKRRIGDHVPIMVAGAPFSPQALTSHLLRWVVDTVTERMGEPPGEVMLTHPANWGPFRLELLDQVAVMAGLTTARRCTEPEAAAAQYAAQTRINPADRVAVYDLGGGTFDACILEKIDSGFRILGTPEGVEHLGGVDFDEAVLRHVLTALNTPLDPDDPDVTVGLARLRRDCVEAKEILSTDVDTLIPVALPGLNTTVRLTRAEFEMMIRPALTETIATMTRALRNAGSNPPNSAASCSSAAAPESPWSAKCCTTNTTSPPPSTPTPNTTSPSDQSASDTTKPTSAKPRPAPPPRFPKNRQSSPGRRLRSRPPLTSRGDSNRNKPTAPASEMPPRTCCPPAATAPAAATEVAATTQLPTATPPDGGNADLDVSPEGAADDTRPSGSLVRVLAVVVGAVLLGVGAGVLIALRDKGTVADPPITSAQPPSPSVLHAIGDPNALGDPDHFTHARPVGVAARVRATERPGHRVAPDARRQLGRRPARPSDRQGDAADHRLDGRLGAGDLPQPADDHVHPDQSTINRHCG